MALFNVWKTLTSHKDADDVSPGEKIVLEACIAPIKKIAENAGQSKDVIVNELTKRKTDDAFLGYNAATNEYVDMVKEGVIDPVKVTRTAMKNAASVATTFLSLDAVIVEDLD